jgi:hypothetical protein
VNDIPEAIGNAIEGGLLARAVEPKAGEARDGHTHEGACLNCGAVLAGPYCHECGQHAHVHRTLGAFFHDFLHGVFHFEGKIWRTLPLLVWRPGKLTREYIDGRRASYVSPIALFLFVTFIAFALVHLVGNPVVIGSSVSIDGKTENLAQGERTLDAKLAGLEADRKAAVAAHKPTAAIDSEITDTQDALATVHALNSGDLEAIAAQLPEPSASGGGRLSRAWKEVRANPDLVLYKLQANAYKYSWLLIPISVPFVWLMFAWRRRYNLYDHTVFVTYSLPFVKLVLILGILLTAVGLRPLAPVPLLYAPFHMFRHLRETYGLGLGGALVRTALLIMSAGIALFLWAMALVAMVLV